MKLDSNGRLVESWTVAPLAGAWIEIIFPFSAGLFAALSLPSRERGLKSCYEISVPRRETVAPLAGAWIEMRVWRSASRRRVVAPLAGAWIEIFVTVSVDYKGIVAPLAGAWIEILMFL